LNVFDFLAHLRGLDILVSADNGKLRINAPKGAVTSEIKAELTVRKEEILSVLSQADPILPEPIEAPLPLSLAQEHLWQLHRLTPDTAAYNMYSVFRIGGQLDDRALEAAIHEVVERHAILRTSFPKSVEGIPEQSIAPVASIVLRRLNLSYSGNLQNELQAVIDAEVRMPFDLSAGPLFRPVLVQSNPNEHVLIFVMHHLISDGHSFGIFYEDLERAYRAASEGSRAGWAPLPLQYAHYAAWQRKWLGSDASTSDRSFWMGQLSGDVPALELPFDHPNPFHKTADGDQIELRILPQLSTAVQELCRREGVTLFATVLTAFNVLLHRHSGQRDLLICTPVAARDRIEFQRLMGYFNNTLLLRTRMTDLKTVRELLQHTQALVMNALAHQMFPFKEVASFPNMARTPLSRAMVAVQNSNESPLHLPGLTVEMLPVFNQAVQYDLAVEVTVTSSNQLGGRFMYRKALFERETVEKLVIEWVAVLQEMLANLDSPISRDRFPQQIEQRNDAETARLPFMPARTDLERRLAQIWQEVLNVEKVGIHDGFFELGGHSLLALRLFTRIEQEIGTNLPLSTLFETTTIAHLAHIIEAESAGEAWGVLVPIRPLGSRPPFFCVHGIGGGVLGYRDLVNYLGDDQPFFGLQAFGQDGNHPYDLTIEAMAERYIHTMRSHQPVGPYRIGGYCFGGVVAYEMACQLERMGEQVALLAIFEGAMPDALDTRVAFSHRLSAVWKSMPTWITDYASMSPVHLINRVRSTLFKIWVKFQRNPNIERRVLVEETLDIDIGDLPRRNIELTELHLQAALDYKPEEYHGVVTLFRARNRSINEVVFGSLDPKMGWGQLASGGVSVHLVDGFHRNMHLAPHARSLAAELRKCLDLTANDEHRKKVKQRTRGYKEHH
jgi:thioesterase domain-containing protein/acyl carrier protein